MIQIFHEICECWALLSLASLMIGSGPYWAALGFIQRCSGRYGLPGQGRPSMWVDRPGQAGHLSRQPGVSLATWVVVCGSDAFR